MGTDFINKPPAAVLDAWAERINRGDLAGVLDLYDEAALLLPTFAPQLLDTEAARRAYFENLLRNLKGTVALTGAPEVRSIGEHVHALSGLYEFSAREDGAPRAYPARYTFVINQHSPRPIVAHHSSLLPSE